MLELILLLVLAIGVYVVILYNSLVKLREQVKNAWHQIDVQLKRRADLIPNLINTVKGYMKHEKELLTKVTELRSKIVSGSPRERAEADNMLSETLKSLFAVSENYPDLKANQNFLALQEELTTTENKVSYARQAYNDLVYMYNTKTKTFPSNLVASLFGFKEEEYFEVENERERKAPEVKF